MASFDKRIPLKVTWFASFFFLLFLSGCSSGPESLPKPVVRSGAPEEAHVLEVDGLPGGRLTYPLLGEVETFNPLAIVETRSATLIHLTTATLLEKDPLTGQILPGLVSSWDQTEEGLKIILSIRKGVRFSDGEPFTADDVIFTFEQIYRDDSNNILKDSILIAGEPIEVSKVDDFTVQLRFPKVYAPIEHALTTIPVLPKHLLENRGKPIEELWTLDTPLDQMAGLGPFVIRQYEPGLRAILSANPYYWKVDSSGTQLPYLEEVIIEYVPDRNNQLLRFQAGELDFLDYVLPEDFILLQQRDDVITRDLGPSSAVSFIWFNLTSAEPGTQARAGKRWFASQNFRKAICSAMDREAIVNNVFQGKATAAVNLLSTANPVWFSPEIETCQFDPDRSRDLLSGEGFQWKRQGSREVLYDSSGSPVTFELVTRSEDILGKVAAIVQQDLAEIGIELSIRQEEHRAVISRVMGSRDYDSALMKLDMGTEPAMMSGIFLSSGPLHIWNPGQSRPATGWEAEIDQWMGLQAITPDQTERQKIFRQVQRSLADQAVLIPLVHNNVLAAWQKDFRNMRPAQIFPFTLWNVWEISRIEETSN